jgi:hypothetical protein
VKALFKTFALGAGIVLSCMGCGSGVTVVALVSPTISGVSPQVVTAGTPSVTLTIRGANFTSESALTFNGTMVPTSVVSSDTLAAQVGGSALAQPTVAQLQVQNADGVKSNAVPLTVTGSDPPELPAPLTITTSALPNGQVGAAYAATLAASGGAPSYTWSISTGSLPAGLTLSAGGVISGTATASGTFHFTVQVADSSSPAQTATASFSITESPATSPAPLTITSTTLPGAQVGASYSATLGASGGTPAYTWSISSGSLPAGLALSSAGVISGTPTSSGTANFTVQVADSGSPAQTQTASLSITVTATRLAITTTSLAAGEDGTAYSATLAASGGTPGYVWSLSSGALPAGLALSRAGIISGMPTGTGNSSFTVTVTDSGSPVQIASWTASINVTAAPPPPPTPGTTWYVRPDGGTRYTTNVPTGQCDGKGDAPYPGSGVNQHCAFNDVRFLYMDGTYADGTHFPAWGWVIAGGDTVIFRGSIGTGVSYRIGINGGGSWVGGIWGNPFGSGIPVPPSGTASQPTRILGENWQNCSAQSARTQLHGGWGTFNVLNLSGTSYVDVECLDITDFTNCNRNELARVPCEVGGQVVADFAQTGIEFSNTTTHLTLNNIRAHGLAVEGFWGPTGDGTVMKNIDLIGNASAGWNADPATSPDTTGIGSLLVQNFNISWNGCTEEYPMVDPLPYDDCQDDSSGGYGDGFGTATVNSGPGGWQVHFDQGVVSYNTQDGLDALHIRGAGSTMTVTRTLAYGNQGQQIKVGGATATIQNSLIVGNCEAMRTEAIPGTPAGFGSLLADPCRAGNVAVVVETTPGDPAVFQFNTLYSKGSIGLEVEYATADQGNGNTLLYNDNIFVGFNNPTTHENPSPIYSTTGFTTFLTNPGASWTNNVTFGEKAGLPCPRAGETDAICGDPGLIDETYHAFGYGDMTPASTGNAVQGAGVAVPEVTTDYTGSPRGNPPSIGAYE